MDLDLRSIDRYNFTLCVAVDICMQCLFFVVAVVLQFDQITDFAGGINFIVIALMTYFLSPVSERHLWNFRLGFMITGFDLLACILDQG